MAVRKAGVYAVRPVEEMDVVKIVRERKAAT
jgi:hypothetical protein